MFNEPEESIGHSAHKDINAWGVEPEQFTCPQKVLIDVAKAAEGSIVYRKAPFVCTLRLPPRKDDETGGSHQELSASIACSCIRNLKLDTCHRAKQSSQLFSPDWFRSSPAPPLLC